MEEKIARRFCLEKYEIVGHCAKYGDYCIIDSLGCAV